MSQQVVSCGHDRRPIRVKRKGQHLVVDIHCHLNIPEADRLVRSHVEKVPDPLAFLSADSRAVNGRLFASLLPKLNGLDERLADMDRQGVDVQAISPSPGQYYYFAPAEVGRDAARVVNDAIATAVARHPDRLVGMGTVPLQNIEMAVAELRRCVGELDLRGIEISTHVNGRELSAEEFRKFFAVAEELGVLLFIHPLGFSHGQRLAEHYLDNIVGNPLESTIALSHMIFGGVLDRHPGLRLCVAHGGGYLPGYWGRMDHAFRVREDCRRHISRAPSSYLRQVWLDTLVFDPDELESLVRTHGVDRLCLGTDYPFDMGEDNPVGFHARLSLEAREKILGGNAAELLGLTVRK